MFVCLFSFRLWEAGWKGRYYKNKFQLSENDDGYDDFRKKVVRFYNTLISTGFKTVWKMSLTSKKVFSLSLPQWIVFFSYCRPMLMWKDFAGFCCTIIKYVNLFPAPRSPGVACRVVCSLLFFFFFSRSCMRQDDDWDETWALWSRPNPFSSIPLLCFHEHG